MDTCIFCKIINREIPSQIVYEDEKVIAFNDIKPAAPVHVLIVPKVHIENVAAMDTENIGLINDIHMAAKKIAISLKLSGFRMITNCGESAGQTVMHLHYHLIGGRELGEKLI